MASQKHLHQKTITSLNEGTLTIPDMHKTKLDAFKAGHGFYFTGEICRNGHVAPRGINGACHTCQMKYLNRYAKTHRDKMNYNSRQWKKAQAKKLKNETK